MNSAFWTGAATVLVAEAFVYYGYWIYKRQKSRKQQKKMPETWQPQTPKDFVTPEDRTKL